MKKYVPFLHNQRTEKQSFLTLINNIYILDIHCTFLLTCSELFKSIHYPTKQLKHFENIRKVFQVECSIKI